MKSRKGFTLIEVVIVLSIIAVVSAFAYPRITGYMQMRQEQYRENQEYLVNKALMQYYALTGRYYVADCIDGGIVRAPADMFEELRDKTGAFISDPAEYQYRNEKEIDGADVIISRIKTELK